MLRSALVAGIVILAGCSVMPVTNVPTAPSVDINRFMGDWYVIAHIPTALEKQAYNAVESYSYRGDGIVDTTFSFRKGGFDGKEKVYHPTGFIQPNTNNTVWRMQFLWPLKADYRVVYLDDSYATTIIGRNQRDYVWIMAREPELPEAVYATLVDRVADAGYDVSGIRKVPQRWDTPVVSM